MLRVYGRSAPLCGGWPQVNRRTSRKGRSGNFLPRSDDRCCRVQHRWHHVRRQWPGQGALAVERPRRCRTSARPALSRPSRSPGRHDRRDRGRGWRGSPAGPRGAHVEDVQFSPRSQLLATSGDDSTVRPWDVSGEPTALARSETGHRFVFAVAISPDGVNPCRRPGQRGGATVGRAGSRCADPAAPCHYGARRHRVRVGVHLGRRAPRVGERRRPVPADLFLAGFSRRVFTVRCEVAAPQGEASVSRAAWRHRMRDRALDFPDATGALPRRGVDRPETGSS
ncbi:hypothetical protein [Saccharothrix obliqua]|uniref:hypothetical protein n=1 Tax=Saccharothrix obliqua TaxID=2861747 RepID=UPI0035569791